jgi:hypothetical protein
VHLLHLEGQLVHKEAQVQQVQQEELVPLVLALLVLQDRRVLLVHQLEQQVRLDLLVPQVIRVQLVKQDLLEHLSMFVEVLQQLVIYQEAETQLMMHILLTQMVIYMYGVDLVGQVLDKLLVLLVQLVILVQVKLAQQVLQV